MEVEGDTATSSGQLNKPDAYRPAGQLELLSFKLTSQKELQPHKPIITALLEERNEL